MSQELLHTETKNFLTFAEDLNTDCVIIFERNGNFSIYATRKTTSDGLISKDSEQETINRISENLYKVFYAKKQPKPSLLTKITQFFTGAK